MKFYIYPYKKGSKSASALALALEGKVLRREGSIFQPGPNKKVVNWGSSSGPNNYDMLNPPYYVGRMGNKLVAFSVFSTTQNGPRIPKITASRDEALTWFEEPHKIKHVVARTVLTGHSGQGIVIVDKEHSSDLPEAPLYVEFVPKDAEYRIHVFNNEVIDVQRKVRDPSREPTNWKVRSHHNGFIYTRNTSSGQPHKEIVQPDVIEQAKRAMAVSGLTFGGIDVIWNENRKQAYVLEINTAPGLEGETIVVYAGAVKEYFDAA